ncbi:MAG: DUF2851 family protein [Bacteroidota bacterium]
MKEAVLHYLWQQQAFNREALYTTDGRSITVQSAGLLNTNAGPDFAIARLQIAELAWSGSVEIHVKASDWQRHGHQHDPAYNRVILHVVWENDRDAFRADGTIVPTLELKSRISPSVISRIRSLLRDQAFIPCEHLVHQVPEIIKMAQVERVAIQRLERKASEVLKTLEHQQGDWSATVYQYLLKGFGFKINQEGMQQLAQAFPLRWVRKYAHRAPDLTYTLLHQAGLSEYAAHQPSAIIPPEMSDRQINPSVWKYSRTRPTNFPHVRIQQLAYLLHQWRADITWLLQIHPVTFYRDQFNLKNTSSVTPIGGGSIDTLIINTVATLLTAYGLFHHNDSYHQYAWQCLRELKAENNTVTRKYVALGFPNESALDTQGMLELNQTYCTKKQCLSCGIGVAVLKKEPLFVSSSS